MARPPRSIALVGLGWHARRIYYPWLEAAARDGRLRLSAVIDVAAKEAPIREYLAGRAAPDHLAFVGPGAPPGALDPQVAELLLRLRAAGRLDALVVSTDPLARKPYLLWALKHDVDVLLDKPLVMPAGVEGPGEAAARLRADFDEVSAALLASRARVVVQAQRRAHPGYRFIREYLFPFVEEHRVPVSFLDLYHGDGMWVMPDEWDRDHHPYKHGTGKLLHSGYHFADLCSWLLACNDRLDPVAGDDGLYAQPFHPPDFVAMMAEGHERLFGPAPAPPDLGGHGEVDLCMLGAVRSAGRAEARVSLQLLGSSLSRRASPRPPADPYKGAGRVRHERLNLHVGPLLNIQVHSYQAHEVRDERLQLPYGPGHLHHFDVLLFRNSDLVGGAPFERVEFGRLGDPQGHNEGARTRMLADFLAGVPTGSELPEHRRTNELIAALYDCIEAGRRGGPPTGRCRWR